MARIYTDNSLSIGRTPLVRLNRIVPQRGDRPRQDRGAQSRPIRSSAASAPP